MDVREEALETLRSLGIMEVPNDERDWHWFWLGMVVSTKQTINRMDKAIPLAGTEIGER